MHEYEITGLNIYRPASPMPIDYQDRVRRFPAYGQRLRFPRRDLQKLLSAGAGEKR